MGRGIPVLEDRSFIITLASCILECKHLYVRIIWMVPWRARGLQDRRTSDINGGQGKMQTNEIAAEISTKHAFSSIRAARLGGGRPISELVHETLRNAILDAQLVPGETLSENELAGRLEVSRTPLREAIKKLQSEGLVTVLPQIGTFVSQIDLARVKEALFMREAVECAAIARLPSTIGSAAAERLTAIVDNHIRASEINQLHDTMHNDEDFHRFLLELAGVPGVWRYVLEARETHRRVRVLSHVQTQFDAARHAAKQHKEIATVIVAGNHVKAAELLRDHIRTNLGLSEAVAKSYPKYFVNV
jgi:DNA-binding GntR family transcriptional regulator